MPVRSRVSSAEANEAFFTPIFLRTTPFTSSRVVASTRHATYTRGSPLPTTTIAFADWSSVKSYVLAERGGVGQVGIARDDLVRLPGGSGRVEDEIGTHALGP